MRQKLTNLDLLLKRVWSFPPLPQRRGGNYFTHQPHLRTAVFFWMGALISLLFGTPSYDDSADLSPLNSAALPRGAQVYQQACACCHGNTGTSDYPTVPSLKNSRWLSRNGDASLSAIILHGAWGELDERRPRYGVMPALGTWLSDADIAAVIIHVRNEWAMQQSTATPETVRLIREQTAARRMPWTAAELRGGTQTP